MKRLPIGAVCIVGCLLVTMTANALTVAYGRRDIEKAATGCVGGWVSAYGNTAYFQGDTETLNRQLVTIARSVPKRRNAIVVLHTGKKFVDDPVEQPLTGIGQRGRRQLAIDWSVRRQCSTDDILLGQRTGKQLSVAVDIWIANDIDLNGISIPAEFAVESGGEIEKFINRQSSSR